MAEHYKPTDYGFEWGPIAIERLCHHKGFVAIRIKALKTGKYVDIECSPNGRKLYVSMIRKMPK